MEKIIGHDINIIYIYIYIPHPAYQGISPLIETPMAMAGAMMWSTPLPSTSVGTTTLTPEALSPRRTSWRFSTWWNLINDGESWLVMINDD